MKNPEDTLKFRPKASSQISLNISQDVLESLQQVAQERDMSLEALLKFYIGSGLRKDLSQAYLDKQQSLIKHSATNV